MSEVPRKRVLIADTDEVVAFIASHILSRYDFVVDIVTSAAGFRERGNGYDAVVVSDHLAAELREALETSCVVVIGKSVPGVKPFAHLQKPLELDVLVATVGACVNRR